MSSVEPPQPAQALAVLPLLLIIAMCLFAIPLANARVPAVATTELPSRYVLVHLGALPGYTGSVGWGINAAGQVVGMSYLVEGTSRHACLWSDGQVTDLGTLPGGSGSTALGINASTQSVGWSTTDSGATHAVLWVGGTITDLGTLGGSNSTATSINSSGQIVGVADTASGRAHAFLYQNGQMVDLGTLGGATSFADDINDASQIVGKADSSGGVSRAFLWSNGQMIDLGGSLVDEACPALSVSSEAVAINASGEVLGTAYSPCSGSHGGDYVSAVFRYSGGITSFPGFGSGKFSYAVDLNSAGHEVWVSGPTWKPSFQGGYVCADSQCSPLDALITASPPASFVIPHALNDADQIVVRRPYQLSTDELMSPVRQVMFFPLVAR